MAVMKFSQLEHTKMLFPAAEMVPSHPTDPVELRRLHYQTPGTVVTLNFRPLFSPLIYHKRILNTCKIPGHVLSVKAP